MTICWTTSETEMNETCNARTGGVPVAVSTQKAISSDVPDREEVSLYNKQRKHRERREGLAL